MKSYYEQDGITIFNCDCRDIMPTLDAESIDAIVTDPPYGLDFMGKGWDHGIPGVEFWTEALRVAKPGAHLLAFGGTRTFHRLAVAIEDAGWEIRDCVMWVYGSGFPKSLDVSKAIDKAAGAERAVVGVAGSSGSRRMAMAGDFAGGQYMETSSATPAARQWEGWGTALKPAWEPIIVARKPLVGTVAANVLRYGTGAINVDGCRIEANGRPLLIPGKKSGFADVGVSGGSRAIGTTDLGRFPANLIHDGSEEVLALFPETTSKASMRGLSGRHDAGDQSNQRIKPYTNTLRGHADSGSAARFFYTAKASASERGECDHPTVKPLALMRYLCRLVTPPGGLVLDPFAGSGTTGRAAALEGFRSILVEQDEHNCQMAAARFPQGVLL